MLRSLLISGSRLYVHSSQSQIPGFWSFNEFTTSVLSFALWRERGQKFSGSTVTLIVHALAVARHELMDLAKQWVSITELRRCGWYDPSSKLLVSDAVATALVKSLHEKEIDVPPSLWPSTERSIYHDEWMTANAADRLLIQGFEGVDLVDDAGQTPLLINAHFSSYNCYKRNACLHWFLDHGAQRVVFPRLNNSSLTHILAANLGRAWTPQPSGEHGIGEKDNTELIRQAKASLPAVLDLVFSLVSPSQRDECQCYCSHAGCLPVHALLKHMRLVGVDSRWPKTLWSTWEDEQRILDLWNQCSIMSSEKRLECSEICRLQIFNRLGMRHTCCMFESGFDIHENTLENRISCYEKLRPEIRIIDDSERTQFQEEDTHPSFQLDAFMDLYYELDTEYQNEFSVFWNTWWAVLEEYVPSVNWDSRYFHRDGRGQVDHRWKGRHVQIHDELLPIEEHELSSKIEQIREQVTATIAAYSED